VRRSTRIAPFALDLHVLGTPPAFVLSQDQTLQLKIELFELAYLPLLPDPVCRPSRACFRVLQRAGVAVRDTPPPRRSASRRIRKRRAHPIELTAVSAIVLDLLSGFQRPSRRPSDRHQSVGGPTLLRSASEAVKHPLWAGTPVISRTCTSIHELSWRPSERTQPAADPGEVRPRGRVSYRWNPTLSTCRVSEESPEGARCFARRDPGPVEPARNLFDCSSGATTCQPPSPARRAAHRSSPDRCEGRAR
jgi:hypothetical protein